MYLEVGEVEPARRGRLLALAVLRGDERAPPVALVRAAGVVRREDEHVRAAGWRDEVELRRAGPPAVAVDRALRIKQVKAGGVLDQRAEATHEFSRT